MNFETVLLRGSQFLSVNEKPLYRDPAEKHL